MDITNTNTETNRLMDAIDAMFAGIGDRTDVVYGIGDCTDVVYVEAIGVNETGEWFDVRDVYLPDSNFCYMHGMWWERLPDADDDGGGEV